MSRDRVAALGAALLVCGCRNDWRTDMWYQPGGGLHSVARPEPDGSVPLEARPKLLDRDEAEDIKEPFPSDAASVARGRALFAERCVACHGPEGHGDGPVSRPRPADPKTGVVPKTFPPAPDLGYAGIQAKPDGYLYATLLLGGKAMPSPREGLDERDLWDLVHFVRTLRPAGAR